MTAVASEPEQAVERVAHGSLVEALHALQAEAPLLELDKSANTGSYTYKYTSLKKLHEQVGTLMTKHGLVFSAKVTSLGGEPALRYKLAHLCGEADEDVMLLPGEIATAQAQGSGISYGRRYAMITILNLVAETDDDGRSASDFPRAPRADSPRAGTTVNLREHGKGLSDRAINVARAQAGLEHVEEKGNDVWLSLGAIQPELATALEEALRAAKEAEG